MEFTNGRFYLVDDETFKKKGPVVQDDTDEECDALAEEAYNNLIRSLIKAGGEMREAKELLARSLEILCALGDNCLADEWTDSLAKDIKEFLEDTE